MPGAFLINVCRIGVVWFAFCGANRDLIFLFSFKIINIVNKMYLGSHFGERRI
jgi:hypothetical protein